MPGYIGKALRRVGRSITPRQMAAGGAATARLVTEMMSDDQPQGSPGLPGGTEWPLEGGSQVSFGPAGSASDMALMGRAQWNEPMMPSWARDMAEARAWDDYKEYAQSSPAPLPAGSAIGYDDWIYRPEDWRNRPGRDLLSGLRAKEHDAYMAE